MRQKKCDMCQGTGKITAPSGYMQKLTGHENNCPTCLGRGWIYK